MKKFICLIPLFFGLNVIVTGCGERGRQSETRIIPSPSTVLNRSLNDSYLENAVRQKLVNDVQLKLANLSVTADADRNEVTLSGTVRSQTAREKAIALAKSAKPGVLINDQIDVKPAG